MGRTWIGFPLSHQAAQPERTPLPPQPSNPRPHQLPHELQPHPTSSLMPARAATRTRDPAQQWLVLEPNRIEKQYWKDLWRYRELFAILAWRDITVRYGIRQFRRMEKRFADVI
jgi:hypothetical protein